MANISSLGIGSGLDVSTIITQLMAIERAPLDKLETAETKIQSQISEVGKIKSALSTFRDVAAKLASSDFWKQTTGSASSSAVSVTTSSSAVAGSYSVEVQALAKAQSIATAAYASSSTLVGTGTLSIELGTWGANQASFTASASAIDITIEATDTLAGVRDKINAADAGVTATIVSDANGARLMIRSEATGAENGFRTSVSGTGLGGLAFDPSQSINASLQLQEAADAEATIDGLAVSSSSNTFTDVLDGVTLTVSAVTTAALTVDIEPDTETIKAKLEEFATAYTALSKLIVTDTKYDATTKTAGTLQGDSAIVSLQNRLRSMLGATSGASTVFARLSDAGFEMQQDGSLTVNDTKLDNALANLGELTAMFSNSSLTDASLDGFGKRFRVFASDVLGIDGALTSRTTGLNDKLTRNQDSQDRMETRLAQTQKRLEAQYSALDAKMANLNSLSTYITQQIAQWNSA